MRVGENEVHALVKAASVNGKPFWPSLSAKALANVNIRSLFCDVGAGGPAQQLGLHQQEVLSLHPGRPS